MFNVVFCVSNLLFVVANAGDVEYKSYKYKELLTRFFHKHDDMDMVLKSYEDEEPKD